MPVAWVGVEPTNDHQALDLAALPVCVPRQQRSAAGWVTRHRHGANLLVWFQARPLTVSRSRRVPGGSRTHLCGLEGRCLGRSATGTRKRKERESNPQGWSLVRVVAGCHRPLACPSVTLGTPDARPEGPTVQVAQAELARLPFRHRGKPGESPRRDSNPHAVAGTRFQAELFVCFCRWVRLPEHPAGVEPARPPCRRQQAAAPSWVL